MERAIVWMWLQHAIGVGQPQSEAILRDERSVEDLYALTEYPSSWALTAEQSHRLKDKDLSEMRAVYKELEALGAWVMTPEDPSFDAMFGGMYAPPLALYGKGARIRSEDAPAIAVVGTRRPDEAGVLTTRCLSAGLAASGAIIITGGARGLDSEAIKAALDEGGRCISFQACGIDVDYPKETAPIRRALLEHGGTLLTEFPIGAPALRHHFRIRNRLISAAARGTLVTQAPLGSGALLTASWAREQGRDVFVAPGAVGTPASVGSNELLKDGAKPVTNTADILVEYLARYPFTLHIDRAADAEKRAADKVRREAAQPPSFSVHKPEPPREQPTLKVAQPQAEIRFVPCPVSASEPMRQVYDALSDEPVSVSELARTLNTAVASVLSSLTMLELQGAVRCEAGQRYALKREHP